MTLFWDRTLSDNRAVLDFERGELILQEDRYSFRSQSVEEDLQSILSATSLSLNKRISQLIRTQGIYILSFHIRMIRIFLITSTWIVEKV